MLYLPRAHSGQSQVGVPVVVYLFVAEKKKGKTKRRKITRKSPPLHCAVQVHI